MIKLVAALLLAGAAYSFGANATWTLTYGTYQVASQMTAPETTAALQVSRNATHCIDIKVASINTSVTWYIEASTDGTNWFNMDASESVFTKTANGVYGFRSEARVKYIRVRWSAEAGGATATLDINYYGGTQ